jgi:hypothetical protein
MRPTIQAYRVEWNSDPEYINRKIYPLGQFSEALTFLGEVVNGVLYIDTYELIGSQLLETVGKGLDR